MDNEVSHSSDGRLTIARQVFPRGFRGERHSSSKPQVIYVSVGAMTLWTAEGAWVVPAGRGCWVPSGVLHSVDASVGFQMRSIYLKESDILSLPRNPAIVLMSRLQQEIIEALSDPDDSFPERVCAGLTEALIATLKIDAKASLARMRAVSAPLRALEDMLLAAPADRRGIEHWAAAIGLGPRTLSRRLQSELGVTFSSFRSAIRIQVAGEMIAQGVSVTVSAHSAGFGTASRFIAAFRRATGTTPFQYFRGAAIDRVAPVKGQDAADAACGRSHS